MRVLECRGCPLVAIDDMEYVFHLVVDLKYKSQEQQNYKNKKKKLEQNSRPCENKTLCLKVKNVE